MPVINLTWTNGTYGALNSSPYQDHAWINVMQWRLGGVQGGTLMPTGAGLYVIQNPNGTLVYAGQAVNLRDRFLGRTNAMGNFNLLAATLANASAYICTVNAVANINLAERWLVRFLYVRDSQQAARTFQNILLTTEFEAPDDGLTINNNGTRPAFVDAQYTYMPGEDI